ncbi:MAG: glycosyltransferase family 2 protein [Saprospiraceae bacterium]|nr:glycosyltransferase family 2 protein [Saprospiraceae bacterium]WKZ64426.1 MAG: glycosyltransferase family 2 protein [Saprospiraceae bacterium]
MTSVSIVIVNYNNYNDTIEYVKQLLIQKNILLHIVIVDNASKNLSFSKLKEAFGDTENIYIIKSIKNGGYSYGNNLGLHFIEMNKLSNFVIISNNDIELVNENFISEFVLKYNQLPKNKGFASPVMYNGALPSSVAARKLPNYLDELLRSSILLNKILNKKFDYDFIKSNGSLKVDCLPGSFFLGTIELFHLINYFDENVFLFGEEKILAFKIKQKQLQNYLICDMKFIHNTSTSISQTYNLKERYLIGLKSRIYFWKNYIKLSKPKLFILKYISILFIYENLLIMMFKNALLKRN